MSFSADTRCPCHIIPAANFGDRAGHLSIDILLLHYTGMKSGTAALEWLCKEESGVSCHYLVEEDGSIFQLVPEEKRAWHAGNSCWQGEADTNSRSIGIEIVNPGHEHGYAEFPDRQIASVVELSQDIVSRYSIPARNVLAHSDVAPGRKQDPGEKFPWKRLHEEGVGIWVPEVFAETETLKPGQNGQAVSDLQTQLNSVGYCLAVNGNYDQQTENCVAAFQMHFRQSKIDGIADASTRAALLAVIELVD